MVYGTFTITRRTLTWFIKTKNIARARRRSIPSIRFQLRAWSVGPGKGMPHLTPRVKGHLAVNAGWCLGNNRWFHAKVLINAETRHLPINEFSMSGYATNRDLT